MFNSFRDIKSSINDIFKFFFIIILLILDIYIMIGEIFDIMIYLDNYDRKHLILQYKPTFGLYIMQVHIIFEINNKRVNKRLLFTIYNIK